MLLRELTLGFRFLDYSLDHFPLGLPFKDFPSTMSLRNVPCDHLGFVEPWQSGKG